MPATTTMLGKGLYDAAEVAWLLGHDTEWVVRWSTASAFGPPIATPSFDRRFAFVDLVSLKVGTLIRSQGVSDRHLRQGVKLLRSWTNLERPLSHQYVIGSLATSGPSLLSKLHSGEYEDIGQGCQRVFQETVRISLKRIRFNSDGNPERWTPAQGIVIDPAIQAGGTLHQRNTGASHHRRRHARRG